MATHEKMTFLGSRFFEKGRRSGSCFDAQSSMMRYSTQPIPTEVQTVLWRDFDVSVYV
jgi:hypothetical protein